MKTTQYDETKYQWLDLFSSRQALLNCIPFDLGIFPRNILLNFVATDIYVLCVGHLTTNIRINLSNFVATDVYAFLCWSFSHKFTHNFVATDVYALLLKSYPGDFRPILSWAQIWVPPLSSPIVNWEHELQKISYARLVYVKMCQQVSPLNHWQVRKWNHVCQNVPVDTATLVLDFCNGNLKDSAAIFVK